MKKTELKPCPFCGGEASIIGERVGFGPWKAVVAHVCGLCGEAHIAEEEAIKDWNDKVDCVEGIYGDVPRAMRAAWNRREAK
jgi:Lar family restriction alleviation protein